MSDVQSALVDVADELARERFEPRAAHYDAEAEFPIENYVDLREAGLLALRVPPAYGRQRR